MRKCFISFKKEDLEIYAIGKKGRELLERRGYHIAEDLSDLMDEYEYADTMKLCDRLMRRLEKGEIGEIYLAYTNFKNTVSHIPTMLKLLPILPEDGLIGDEEADSDEEALIMNFEPADVDALGMIIPKYVASLLYGALIEATASENGARMQAMDNATNNAEEMISSLTLKYNRARQGSITQELTEIIAGRNAVT